MDIHEQVTEIIESVENSGKSFFNLAITITIQLITSVIYSITIIIYTPYSNDCPHCKEIGMSVADTRAEIMNAATVIKLSSVIYLILSIILVIAIFVYMFSAANSLKNIKKMKTLWNISIGLWIWLLPGLSSWFCALNSSII